MPKTPSPGVREQIFRRDEYRCVYCARILPEPELTVDHVQPLMRGGDGSPGNLVTACRACNTRKGSAPAWAFLAERAAERENFLRYAPSVWPRLRRAVRQAARGPGPRRPVPLTPEARLRRSTVAQTEHLLTLANRFLEEIREDVERALTDGSDTPPRLRLVHERAGHASPEYRTLNIPVPDEAGGTSPTALSALISGYARARSPDALLLALELVGTTPAGEAEPLLIAEARSRAGIRLFWRQSYSVAERRVVWADPAEGGWQDPGGEEMILDAAFTARR